jgi:hypothetical protein
VIALRLGRGGDGELVSMNGESVALISSTAYAPGAPIELTAVLGEGDDIPLRGKCLGSKRRPDDRFDVRARLVNLKREDRERLATLLSSPPAAG